MKRYPVADIEKFLNDQNNVSAEERGAIIGRVRAAQAADGAVSAISMTEMFRNWPLKEEYILHVRRETARAEASNPPKPRGLTQAVKDSSDPVDIAIFDALYAVRERGTEMRVFSRSMYITATEIAGIKLRLRNLFEANWDRVSNTATTETELSNRIRRALSEARAFH